MISWFPIKDALREEWGGERWGEDAKERGKREEDAVECKGRDAEVLMGV